jgi:hypothetical protein
MFDEDQKLKAKKVAQIGLTIFAAGVLLMCMPFLIYGPGYLYTPISDPWVLRLMLCIPVGFIASVVGLITWLVGAKKKKSESK